MTTEEETHLRLEQLAARLDQAGKEDKDRASHFAELAGFERWEAEKWPESSKQRMLLGQRAEELALTAVEWADHAEWSARMAGKLRQRANVHRVKQGL